MTTPKLKLTQLLHARITADQHGNPPPKAELDAIKKELVKLLSNPAIGVLVTEDRVALDLHHLN